MITQTIATLSTPVVCSALLLGATTYAIAQDSGSTDQSSLGPQRCLEHRGERSWLTPLGDADAVLSVAEGAGPTLSSATRSSPFQPGFSDAYLVNATGDTVVIQNTISAKLADIVTPEAFAQWAMGQGLAITEWTTDRICHLTIADAQGQDSFDAVAALSASGLVAWAEPVVWSIAERQMGDNPPIFQWHLNNLGYAGSDPDSDIDAVEAWEYTIGDPDMVYAILDDGVDIDHPDLADRIWFNFGDFPDGADNDGNGYVDDFYGYDFADNDGQPIPSAFVEPFNFVTHNDIHGTPMAGLVASYGSPEGEFPPGFPVELRSSGVVQQGQIMSVRVTAAGQFVSTSQHAAAIRYAVDNGADVIVMGYTLPLPSQEIEEALIHAATNGRGGLGAPVFAAAGDLFAEPVGWPARSPFAISVGGVTNLDAFPPDASFGDNLNLVAPTAGGNVGLFTTDVTIPGRGFDELGSDYVVNFGGTSGATAIAAGTAGLVLSEHPNLTLSQLLQAIQNSADRGMFLNPKADVYGHSYFYGWGRVNPNSAIEYVTETPTIDDALEPNNTVNELTAAPINLPFERDLLLRDLDTFQFTFPKEKWVSIRLEHLPGETPPALEIYLLNGSLLLDTGQPQGDGSLLINRFNDTGQELTAIISVAPRGTPGSHMTYHLTANTRAPDPYEGNNFPADAEVVTVADSPLEAYFDPPGDVDVYAVSGSAGNQVTIETFARRLDPPSPVDTVLTLLRQDGTTVLATSDDVNRSDSLIEMTLPANELYFIRVEEFHGAGDGDHNYELHLSGFTASTPNTSQVLGDLLGTLPTRLVNDINRDGLIDASDVTTSLESSE